MKPREVGILVVAGVGLLYAAWTLFLAPQAGRGAGGLVLDRAGLSKTATDIKGMVDKGLPSSQQVYILARAASPFPRDPFHRTTTPDEAAPSDKTEASFQYSGFLQLGGEQFAIINGMEYREGEELELPDYFLSRIDRTKVTIEHRLPGQAVSNRIVAPLTVPDTAVEKKESNGNGTAH